MPRKKQTIHEYTLPYNGNFNVVIKPLQRTQAPSHDITKPHRDNHYQLLFAFEGKYHFEIDFTDIKIRAPFILCVPPGQVHRTIKTENEKGWAVGIEAAFLASEFKQFLDNERHQRITLTKANQTILGSGKTLLETAHALQHDSSVYTSRSAFTIVNAILCLMIHESTRTTASGDRPNKEKNAYTIEQRFNALMKERYKEWKRPSEYAKALSISTSHLNDTIKTLTGKSVSTQLQLHTITEAKRLLYFTDLGIRQIAFDLGFEDPNYFGRLFRKITSTSPLTFRARFRD